ncbi:DUF2852 domain-containing protein [Tepidamorphus sp. 3E244]|uniref:DUF2852 domain-containing protein n=1 Tax=Tepidamorphus sp. 3E244 TaxID=3385498 RepID=UPI0038FC6C9D
MKQFPIRPAWTPLNILLMIVGFMVFWPLGLAMIAWIVWGDRMIDKVQDAEVKWHSRNSGNAAFDEYRRAELAKLEEKRRQLDREGEEFEAFLRELRSARDMEEFDNFMAKRRAGGSSTMPDEGSAAQPA